MMNMGLYRFVNKLNKKHEYFILYLGDSFSYDKIKENNTVYLTIETIELIEDILTSVNRLYDHYGVTKYNRNEIEK
jgi:hypothetical protein